MTTLTTAPPTRPYSARVVAGDHFEFLHGVGRGLRHLVGVALVAGGVRVVVHAVQHEVVVGAAHAVDVERAFARRHGVGINGTVDVYREQRQIGEVAAVERQFDDGLGADHLAVLAGIGFEGRGRADDVDGLVYDADLEREVDALAGIHSYVHVPGLGLLKTGGIHRNGVTAHLHVEEIVVAVLVGGGLGFNAGILVDQQHGRLGHDGPGGIVNGAEHLGAFELCHQTCGSEQESAHNQSKRADFRHRFASLASLCFNFINGGVHGCNGAG